MGELSGYTAQHFRERAQPSLPPAWRFADGMRSGAAGGEDAAQAALEGRYTVIGIEHRFADGLPDFTFNPTTVPGSERPRNHEWLWQFGRFYWWPALATAYRRTGDERYAQRWALELQRWLEQAPVPEEVQNVPGSRWRTIECGIRLANAWPVAFFAFRGSPSVSDDLLLAFIASWADHARYLERYPTRNNWLTMEMNGLFHAGVLFPELPEAARWRDTAMTRLRGELDAQVYPDGAQVELATGYHTVSLRNFVAPLRLARHNGVAVAEGYEAGLGRQSEYLRKIRDPLGTTPDLNDGGRVDVAAYAREALELFPHREDFRWAATSGQEGHPPTYTSLGLPWAGHYVLRSGWDADARYALLDAGPFGAGHQHEDKLSFVLCAFGHDLLIDTGNYPYEDSPYRRYALSSAAHNVVLVDGQGQNRRRLPRETYVAREPADNRWSDSAGDVLVTGTYDDGFGPDGLVKVAHQRTLRLIGGERFEVADEVRPDNGDEAEHTYEALFHLDPDEARLEDDGVTVVGRHADGVGIRIAPVEGRPEVRLVRGQDEPYVLGWRRSRGAWAGGAGGRSPVWVAVYTYRGRGAQRWIISLEPFRDAAPGASPAP